MKIEEGKVVTLEFKVYDAKTNELLEDTTEVGPFFYIQGFGNFVPKVEEALEGKEKGFHTTLDLSVEEGYGEYDEDLIVEMDRSEFTEFDDIYEGLDFIADMDDDTEQSFVITKIEDDVITADGNHPFAGKDLRFEVTVSDVRDASEEELEHGHAHFHGFDD
ncbi:MAG: peptidylprolyl isomerase [Cetobacterium sp.]|uniref:FKBP-type peptidyl-prolyl cis-trans isomerase n=1 Tax=unclassified Cetobacterium TaxID=2630983 RepID=UPI00163CB69B|nr:peptidylprolyl isomerase [Cetobacterium sp. 2A]MBC2856714.1 peptidylprolyl isomerase [Cetobacterium sp. 2A]